MTFATSCEGRGAAVWDVFPADATDMLRVFLRESVDVDDPVMRQTCYISTSQLRKLREEHNIISYRIYQNPGEAVFIPAGCAHQVTSLGK